MFNKSSVQKNQKKIRENYTQQATCGTRKNHVGRLMCDNRVAPVLQHYGIERLDRGFLVWLLSTQNGNTEVRMFHVFRRDGSTLRAIILRHIRPGTEIWTDEWRAYTNIPVNHQQHFVNPINTGANTQNNQEPNNVHLAI